MKERPILCAPPMVRAILSDQKTKTRRIIKPQPSGEFLNFGSGSKLGTLFAAFTDAAYPVPWDLGDRLWVRENFALQPTQHDFEKWVVYQADGMAHRAGMAEDEDVHYRPADPALQEEWTPRLWAEEIERWRPSIHMPRWASRLTLEVTGLRVERLMDMKTEDAWAEGVEHNGDFYLDYLSGQFERTDAISSFISLWESLNGPGSWADNPWVWVVEFQRVEGQP